MTFIIVLVVMEIISISRDGKTAYVGAYYDIDSQGDADLFKIDISELNLFND